MRPLGFLLAGTLLAAGLGPAAARAAGSPGDRALECRQAAVLAGGVRALEGGRTQEAIGALSPLVEAEPTCSTGEEGSAAYWLGEAHARAGRAAEAHAVWERGVQALAERGEPDPRLLDRYLWSLLARGEGWDAERVYLELLTGELPARRPWEREPVVRHLAQVLPLLEDPLRATLDRHVNARRGPRNALPAPEREALAAWWASQDPLPALPENARITEHLQRVALARARYADDADRRGYDDRGETLVRYGEPAQTMRVEFNDFQFSRDVFRFGVDVARSDFPENEVWTYLEGGRVLTYLFVRGRQGYQLGTAMDLLPSQLRHGFDHSPRGQNRAASAIAAMRWIFEKLAVHHPGYMSAYRDVDAYYAKRNALTALVPPDVAAEASRLSGAFGQDDIDAFGTIGLGSVDSPTNFARRTISTIHAQERDLAVARERALSSSRSDLRGTRSVDLAPVRVARLRSPGGRTKLVVYWQEQPGDWARWEGLGEVAALTDRARLVLHDEGWTSRETTADTTYALDLRRPAPRVLAVDLAVGTLATLQVDRLGGPTPDAPWVGGGAASLGRLEPFQTSTSQLAMSDLLAFEVDDVTVARAMLQEGFTWQTTRLFPGATLTNQPALGLYFEVYPPAGAESSYFVSYEVVKRRRGGVLRRQQSDATVSVFRRTAGAEAVPAALLIDRSEWQDADEVEVVVTVLDEASGEELSRTVTYTVGGR